MTIDGTLKQNEVLHFGSITTSYKDPTKTKKLFNIKVKSIDIVIFLIIIQWILQRYFLNLVLWGSNWKIMQENIMAIWKIIYNYGPLCRETSRFVNLRGKNPHRVDKSGCFLTQRVVIILLYFCQCFIGYLPCGEKFGCSAGNNRIVSRQRKFWQNI